MPLKIITTPMPDEKTNMNLLLVQGDLTEKFAVKDMLDSLWKDKLIEPLTLVAVDLESSKFKSLMSTGKREMAYENFIVRELITFAKKKTVIRKFNTIGLYGDYPMAEFVLTTSWDHQDKINICGVADLMNDTSRAANALRKLQSSRKLPKMEIFAQATPNEPFRELMKIFASKNQQTTVDSVSRSDEQAFLNFLSKAYGK